MVAAAKKRRTHTSKKRKGATILDVQAWKWIRAMANHFRREGKMLVPNCIEYAKTSHAKERTPENENWYYIRCAAILRRVYLRPGVGLGGLAKKFGSKKHRGSKPEIYQPAARGLLHWCCKSLEGMKLINKGKESGRVLTREGRRMADTIAARVFFRKKTLGGKVARKA